MKRTPYISRLYLFLAVILICTPTLIAAYDIHSGKYLISTGGRDAYKGPFRNSVIYLKTHTLAGAFGVIINKPLNENEIPGNIPERLAQSDIPIYYGGPVGFPHMILILRYIDGKTEVDFLEALLKKDPDIVLSIIEKRYEHSTKILLGYAGWAPMQLSSEIRKGGWSTLNFNEIYLTNMNVDDIYDHALKTLLNQMPQKRDDYL